MTTGILKHFTNLFYGKVAEDSSKNLASEVEDDKFEILGDENVSAPVDETVNNEEVPTSDPLEESDVDEFEIIEDINPPDSREKSIPASSYEINKSIAEIAGFNKEKLLEMCTFSKMTYGNDDEKLSKAGYKTRVELSKKEGYRITLFLDSEEREAGFVFTKGKEVTIAYRGTQGFNDVLTDVNVSFTVPSFLPVRGRVHKGFYNKFESSRKSLESIIKSHAEKQKVEIKDLKINLTGHSMGGAIAKIAALYFNKTTGAQDIHVAAFGDPRVFDFAASKIYNDALGTRTIRVTQRGSDPVTALAPGFTGYVCVGAQLRIKKSSNHFIHKIDGYYEIIQKMQKHEFQSNDNIVLFYHPGKRVNIPGQGTWGNTITNLVRSVVYLSLVEQTWEEEDKQHPNTEISLSSVSQIAGESRGL